MRRRVTAIVAGAVLLAAGAGVAWAMGGSDSPKESATIADDLTVTGGVTISKDPPVVPGWDRRSATYTVRR